MKKIYEFFMSEIIFNIISFTFLIIICMALYTEKKPWTTLNGYISPILLVYVFFKSRHTNKIFVDYRHCFLQFDFFVVEKFL